MKNFISIMALLCISLFSYGQCDYTLEMNDSYGDGWNGNSIDVLVDGNVVIPGATLGSGSTGVLTFSVTSGADVTTIWNGGGNWGYEITYNILDTDGMNIGSGDEDVNITTGTITANCPSCPAPSDLTIDSTSTTGAVISWSAGTAITTLEYQLLLAGETPAASGITTSENPLTITGCYSNTPYDLYLRSDCSGDYSSWALVSFTTLCDVITTIPFYEGFNSDSTTENCWTILNENGDGDSWDTSYMTNEFEGDEAAVMYTDFNSGSNDDYLISPGLTLTGNERLKFHQRVQSSNEPNDFEVLISTSGIEIASFTNVLLASEPYDNTTYIEYVIDLSAYSGDSYIAFHVPNGGLDGWRLYIDNFIVETIPTCVAPTDLTATASSFIDATLSWTGNEGASSYEIVLQNPGAGAPTGSGTLVSGVTYDASGLTENTTYEFYVRADCDADGFSVWSGPYEFYTGYCDSVPTSNDGQGISSVLLESTNFTSGGDLTYEDFTDQIVDVSQAITANLQVTFATGYTYDTNVWIDFNGDLVYDNDTELVYQGTSTNANPTTLDASFLVPADTALGTYSMRIGTADSGQATPEPCYSGSWGVTVDMLINVTEPPACVPPSDLDATATSFNDATLSWFGNEEGNSYEVVVQPAGAGAPSGAGDAASTTTYDATGLTENTTYEFYVRTDCGDGSLSSWSGPYEFYTGYCDSVPTSNDGQGISSVLLESTNFTSGGDLTYEDFTDQIVDVSQAITANLQVTFATGYTYDTNVWIDFNGDLVYDNDTELVYQGTSTNANPTTLDASFLVPADTALGTYSMRIGTADSGQTTPEPCYSGSYGVTVDMLINVTEPPACIPPSGLTVENITGTTADFSWTGADGNASWEYVILPTGSPAPTTAGTSTTETSVQFTDLDYQTTYDVYVISDCGDSEMSTWAGPLTFTTTIQTDYMLECGGENININYCYTSNDTTTWLFTSDSGLPLEIIFNSGTIEGTFDNLTIYDGTDNTGAVLFNNNTASITDFTGLVVESTLTSVFIEVDSDGSGNCENSTFYTPWNFVVSCKTCVTQSATFEVVGFCEPNQEFYIDVDITDLGSALNLNMTDGTATQTSQSTGVYTFGPYEANTNVIITVTNADDGSCSINSGDLTLICPPAPNDCSIIYAGEDTASCEDGSTNLTAVYHPLGQDTSSYDVTSQQGCPLPPLAGGTPTSIETDDVWSEAIELGFEFCFFGDTYSQILIGSNGVLSFELENADSYNGYNINSGDTLPNASNTTLSEANIFGVAQDIDPSVCGEINYMVLGSSPSRQFVVNFSEVCYFSCNDIKSSSQIILYESSNTIDINIYDKPTCLTWNDGLAVVGVQNIDDTIAFTPPERNTSVWEATDEFWRFTPSLGTNDYVFEWYEGTTLLGTNDTVSVSPTETTTYTASITYNLCAGGTATVTDNVIVEITPNPQPIAISEIVYQCPEGESVLEVTVDDDIAGTTTYYWTYNGIDMQSGPENTYLVPVGQFGEYLVTAVNGECFGDTIITVNEAPLFEVVATSETVYQCPGGESVLEVTVDADIDEIITFSWALNGSEVQSGPENTYSVPEGQFGDYLVTATNEEGCYGNTVITVNEATVPELEDGTSFTKCMNEDVELGITVLNPDLLGDDLEFTWYINGTEVQSGSSAYYTHTAEQENGMITVVVTDTASSCESATTIEVAYYMNQNCVDIPQGLSPNGDGLNDCLELDHLEDKEDIVKIEIFNRYGAKVFEMNDYMNQWCGQNASDGNDGSNELLPVGTYFYVVQFGSDKEPNTSWIYLNY